MCDHTRVSVLCTRPLALARLLARRAARAAGLLDDEAFYPDAYVWATREMRDGDAFDARDVGRVAFPVAWSCDSDGGGGDGGARAKL